MGVGLIERIIATMFIVKMLRKKDFFCEKIKKKIVGLAANF